MEKEENAATVTVIVRYGEGRKCRYSHCNCKVWRRKENVATVTVIVRYGEGRKCRYSHCNCKVWRRKKMPLQSL